MPFEPLHGTQLDVNFLSLALHNIAWVATAVDFAWRAYRSVRLVIKYWGRASLGLPQIDLREDANSAASACTAAGRSPSKLCTALLLSPATGVAFVVGALLLLANVATALYWPSYTHYVHGCITPPRNGVAAT